jgi:hypothetical protein
MIYIPITLPYHRIVQLLAAPVLHRGGKSGTIGQPPWIPFLKTSCCPSTITT